MYYTLEEINRISGSRKATKNTIYIDVKGNKYKGLSDGRLEQIFTSDNSINVNNTTENSRNLNNYLFSLEQSNLKQVEIDFGTTLHQNYKVFTINDNNIKERDIIIANIAYDAPTNKSIDELEMDDIICIAGDSKNGNFKLIVKSLTGSLRDKFKINYRKQWQ